MSTAPGYEMSMAQAGYSASVPRLTVRGMIQFLGWSLLTLNSLGDPLKTLYGYYMSTDSSFQTLVWEMEVTNNFNNISSRVCNDSLPFLDCYYELPVDGTGSLAGSLCRSYYPVDKDPTQHVGNFFGNCTLVNGERIDIPNDEFASTQWSVQTSSPYRQCLSAIGEGEPFPCDTTTTTNGHQINYRPSQTEATMWCKEFGGYFILNRSSLVQEAFLVNVSDPDHPSFLSLALDVNTPVFSLENLIGCPAHIHIGGTASQITTSAWYGETVGSWTAHTTRTADLNRVSWNGSLVHVWTLHYSEGDITIVRLVYKDIFRLTMVSLVVIYRFTSIYYPIYLVYRRQQQSLPQWIAQSHHGLVVHKRERYNFLILFFLTAEAVASVEDIVVYCQHTVFTSSGSIGTFLLNYMSIMRIIWPCSFVLLVFTRLLGCLFQHQDMFKLCENLFLLGAPVVMLYVPFHVTKQGIRLFQGYRWTGMYCHHFTNTIHNVYSNQINCFYLFTQIFGWFIFVNATTTFLLSMLWYWKMPNKSMLSYLFSPPNHRVNPVSKPLELILQNSAKMILTNEARHSQYHVGGAANIAADGLVCLVYGNYHVVGYTAWGISYPIENQDGFVGVIRGRNVSFDDQLTVFDLLKQTSFPMVIGIPDLT
ncbi:hypothetical protein THRCLA_06506 [Thraustotheca clavata]|uniref:Transmembrane protein n=1 Tax=Thraustotheca clavata TaxID=74557 RepID=A0A1V9ZNA5_9STRA|nr:hypothetical protein THRCLA_06506 [Thraustotheca clavata]